jgi:hypothetical protein
MYAWHGTRIRRIITFESCHRLAELAVDIQRLLDSLQGSERLAEASVERIVIVRCK